MYFDDLYIVSHNSWYNIVTNEKKNKRRRNIFYFSREGRKLSFPLSLSIRVKEPKAVCYSRTLWKYIDILARNLYYTRIYFKRTFFTRKRYATVEIGACDCQVVWKKKNMEPQVVEEQLRLHLTRRGIESNDGWTVGICEMSMWWLVCAIKCFFFLILEWREICVIFMELVFWLFKMLKIF